MRRLKLASLVVAAFFGSVLAVPFARAHDEASLVKGAPQNNPLFINMTTGDPWRGWMGLHFAHSTLKMGHPVAVFLNLDAVKLAAKNIEQEKKPSMQRLPRDIIADFIRDGGVVLICGPCMQELGLTAAELDDGVQMGRPGYT